MNIIKRFFNSAANKELSNNIVLTFLIKGAAMLVSILIVPAYTKYFSNDDVYGAWLTISAVFVWMNMFDFGIGNGLRNYLVKTLANKDEEASKKYISSAYVSVGIISLAIFAVGIVLINVLDWNEIMKVSTDVIDTIVFRRFISIVFSGVVIHFFFLLISSICYALQKTFLPGLISLTTQLLIYIYLLIPNGNSVNGKVISLSFVHLFAYNIPILVVTIILFVGKLKFARPSIKFFDKTVARQVMGLGGVFFVIQLALIALNSSNEIYINAFFKPRDVVQYNYYHKLFYVLMVFITLVLQPFWSAITKAYYEKRFEWIKKTYVFLNFVGILLCLSSVILALIYQPLADIWLGKGVLKVEAISVSLFALYTAMFVIANITCSVSNGIGKLKCQMICTLVGAFLKLTIVVFAVIFYSSATWIVVMLANVFAMIPLVIIHPIYMMKVVNKMIRKRKYTVG